MTDMTRYMILDNASLGAAICDVLEVEPKNVRALVVDGHQDLQDDEIAILHLELFEDEHSHAFEIHASTAA